MPTEGGFLFLPSVAASASLVLAETFQLVQFDPTLLSCAKKRGVEPPRRNCPKETLGKGFLWTPSETEGQRPLWHPGLPDTDGCTGWACLRTFERSVVGGTTNLADPTRRKANFLWKFLCAGAAFSAMRTPVPHRSPPRKDFCSAKILAADKCPQICCLAA